MSPRARALAVLLVAACVYLPQGIMGGLAALRSRLSGRGGAA